ncbi:Phosphopentomutase [Moorella thermoacetica]|uniref:Phosphopentomutase n=2 Tax=Neomoorella thermoacetica TaxID=1525 RepID=A0AAC9HJH2_NEOTH|nr:phosphopentomutase [Moorella thermoacetica]AOQ24231.1 Phosphopentomutase [Moorella thermoacetica]APC08710.1 phosphopentomutase [Moorella thermoacetica]TYL14638.1 Phosphopentomutase [Moorella thermoacetica]
MEERIAMKLDRVILIVLDSVGVGALPDAAQYGDEGSNTLAHIAATVDLRLPNLTRLGVGNITPLRGIPPVGTPAAAWGKMASQTAGKDTTSGHWELAGLILERPFPLYPHGFPPEIIEPFEKAIGRRVLGNKPASGTVIIEELGAEHMRTGNPIVYTSADSVFQIAAHEEVIPVEELYRYCKIARRLLTGEHAVGRVIARPFVGEPGHFIRTDRRQDFSLEPPRPTLLDAVIAAGLEVMAVGKIKDIFAGRGISRWIHTHDNMDGVDQTRNFMREGERGLIFTNLVDFDMRYGHRNDVAGYAAALEAFDRRLPELLDALETSDALILTADHGCDPTTPSTDHSREYVPLLIYGKRIRPLNIGVRPTFADLGATVADLLGVPYDLPGKSFASMLLE